jgi:hypothetical protein
MMDISRIKQLAGLSEFQIKEESEGFEMLQQVIDSGVEGEALEEGLWDSLKAIGTSVKAGANAFSSTLSQNVWGNKWDTMVKDLQKVQKDFAAFQKDLMASKWAKELKLNDEKSFTALEKLITKRATYFDTLINDFAADKGKLSGSASSKAGSSTKPAKKERVEPTMNKDDKAKEKPADSKDQTDDETPEVDAAEAIKDMNKNDGKNTEVVDSSGEASGIIAKSGRNVLGTIGKWKIVNEKDEPATVADFDVSNGKAKGKLTLTHVKMGETLTVPVHAIVIYPNKEGILIFKSKTDYYSARLDVADESFKKNAKAICDKVESSLTNR